MQYVWDSDNKKYIDLAAQNICISVGHCNPKVINAAVKQMKTLSHCSSMYYNNKPSELAEKIVKKVPPHPSGEDWVVHLVNNGSEAVDLAIQMAREYTSRPEIFALNKSYHGLQGYAAGLTAIGKSTQSCYSSMFSSIFHVDPNNIEQLENLIKYSTSGKIGGMIVEPLQGYGGIYPLDYGYLKNVFDIIKKHGGVTIADEVQTGYGRCGEDFWGFNMKNNNVIPDMITIAKGMGNGVGIIGAVICRRSIAEAFTNKMFFNTYSCNPVASAAAIEVLNVIEEDNIIENCREQGKLFKDKINDLCLKYPQLYKEIRGSGLFLGLEIYGKTDENSCKNAIDIHKKIVDRGVLLGRGSGVGNLLRIQPPMCIKTKDVYYVIEVLEEEGEKWIIENGL